jgi:hypothetical protein
MIKINPLRGTDRSDIEAFVSGSSLVADSSLHACALLIWMELGRGESPGRDSASPGHS